MNSKKTIILILALIVILLGASAYVAWQNRIIGKIWKPAPVVMTEEEILRKLAPLTAPQLSEEELQKEREILGRLGSKTNEISPADSEKEKEILKSLSAPNR